MSLPPPHSPGRPFGPVIVTPVPTSDVTVGDTVFHPDHGPTTVTDIIRDEEGVRTIDVTTPTGQEDSLSFFATWGEIAWIVTPTSIPPEEP